MLSIRYRIYVVKTAKQKIPRQPRWGLFTVTPVIVHGIILKKSTWHLPIADSLCIHLIWTSLLKRRSSVVGNSLRAILGSHVSNQTGSSRMIQYRTTENRQSSSASGVQNEAHNQPRLSQRQLYRTVTDQGSYP